MLNKWIKVALSFAANAAPFTQMLDRIMTSLYISVFIWAFVVLMLTDDHCRKNEKRAFKFFCLIGVTLTGIGVWTFEYSQVLDTSLTSLVSICLFLAVMARLKLMTKLIKLQSDAQGRSCTLVELNLTEIPETPLISMYKKVNVIMWFFFIAVVILQVLSHGAVSI